MRACRSTIAVAVIVSLACTGDPPDGSRTGEPGDRIVSVWVHSGQPAERETMAAQVARFHAAQDSLRIDLTVIPEGTYNAQVQAAALAGELPDLLELDGPYVYGYIWQGHLVPIDDILPALVRARLIPSIVEQGTYDGRLYAAGTFDSGLALYANRRMLEDANVRVPTGLADPWTIDEFDDVLAALAARDTDGAVLDLKMSYDATEWYTFAFSPILQSAGGDLIDRETYTTASGVLDSDASVRAFERVQSWFRVGYVDPNTDDAAFTGGRVALSWVGHWEYPRYQEALGDELVLVPFPDFGEGPRTGQGSWVWGITTHAARPRDAARFLEFLLRADEVLAMTAANGAVPATREAIARSPLHRSGGPLHLFVTQLDSIAVPRPKTPGYPAITTAFAKAFHDIRDGADVRETLRRAAQAIDRDVADNRGYPARAD